jgi:hypothetical protein
MSGKVLDRLQQWRSRLLRARAALRPSRHDGGFAIAMAIVTGLLVIVGAAIVSTRSLSSWMSSAQETQRRSAREAAEYGFSELVGQLNAPENSYLLVSKYNQWTGITYNDLSVCGIGTPDATSVSGNTLKQAAAGGATVIANSNNRLAYRLTDYQPPALPPGANQAQGPCTSTIVAKFGNLAGGSATLKIIGEARDASGNVTSTHTLERVVSVLPPDDDAIANPILLMATGSVLYGLNGNICQIDPTQYSNISSITSCKDLPLTTVSCVNLADCVSLNLKNDITLSEYCKTSKTFKRNTICNSYQQAPLLTSLPTYPNITNTTLLGSSVLEIASTSKLQSAALNNCASDGACDYDLVFVNTKSNVTYPAAQTFFTANSSKLSSICKNSKTEPILSTTKSTTIFKCKQGNFKFPYATNSAPTTSDSLLPLCTITSDEAATCRIDTLKYSSTSGQLTVHTLSTAPTNPINRPVNLYIGQCTSTCGNNYDSVEFAFERGIVNNVMTDFANDVNYLKSAWKNLRIYSRGFSDTISKACSKEDEIKIDKGRSLGIDGAFLWLPDARITMKRKDNSANYFVAWICELDGDSADTSPSTIITPLQRKDVTAGFVDLFVNFGAGASGGYYRARGITQTVSN